MPKFHAWTMIGPNGDYIVSHTDWTRRGAIESVKSIFGPKWSWRKIKRKGWRVVKVRFVPTD